MTEATWAALTVTLTLLGLAWTWLAFRRRGMANALRAFGFTLLPAAAWLTGTLEMFVEISGSVVDWASSLVLNPTTWTGIALAGAAVASWAVSGYLRDRQLGKARAPGTTSQALGSQRALPDGSPRARRSEASPTAARTTRSSSASAAEPDDEMAEIEALLKKRGIE